MYGEKFCELYNELGWNYAPEAFSEILMKWLEKNGKVVRNSLDLGCGTGVLCDILAKHGIRAAGMDFSENMIRIARERNPEISFEVGDMVVYKPDGRFDLVTSTEDALNHILKAEDVLRVFRNVRSYLNPDGVFIFDVLKEDSVTPGTCIDFDLDEDSVGQISTLLNADGTYSLITTVHKNGQLEFREDIHEIYYDPELIRRLLTQAGFENVYYTDRLLEDSTLPGTNWYFVAR